MHTNYEGATGDRFNGAVKLTNSRVVRQKKNAVAGGDSPSEWRLVACAVISSRGLVPDDSASGRPIYLL